MTSPLVPARSAADVNRARVAGVLIVVMLVSALFYYKWSGSLRTLARVGDTGKLGVAPGALLDGSLFATTLVYFGRIWPALVYGILIGAAVRAAVPSNWIKRWLGASGSRF